MTGSDGKTVFILYHFQIYVALLDKQFYRLFYRNSMIINNDL